MEPNAVESINQVMRAVEQQMLKMRIYKGHTVEADVRHNTNGELALAGTLFGVPDSSAMDREDFKEICEKFLPDWNMEWLLKTREKSYKDRLKVGISLLIAELERVMYLENQRISNNDSSTASSSGNPESDRPGERAGAEQSSD